MIKLKERNILREINYKNRIDVHELVSYLPMLLKGCGFKVINVVNVTMRSNFDSEGSEVECKVLVKTKKGKKETKNVSCKVVRTINGIKANEIKVK